jgi:hypothetical protein
MSDVTRVKAAPERKRKFITPFGMSPTPHQSSEETTPELPEKGAKKHKEILHVPASGLFATFAAFA